VTPGGANAADFVGSALPSGTISFAAGEASKTIIINVAGDTAVETDEGFIVTLSAPIAASIATASATGTIRNDNASLAISVPSLPGTEGNSGTTPVIFTVTHSGDTSGTFLVHWVVRSGAGFYHTHGASSADFADGVLPTRRLPLAPRQSCVRMTLHLAADTVDESSNGFGLRRFIVSDCQRTAESGQPQLFERSIFEPVNLESQP